MQYASQPLYRGYYYAVEANMAHLYTHSLIAIRTTARTAPFMPGESPPLVMTPILFFLPSSGGGTTLAGSVGAIVE